MTKGFKKLNVWEKAYKLTLEIYQLIDKYPKKETYNIVSQMRRASVSISANIAEGYGRDHLKHYIHFIQTASGSCNELEVYIDLSKDLKYLTENEFETLQSLHEEVSKMLFGLRIALQKKYKNLNQMTKSENLHPLISINNNSQKSIESP